MRSQPGSAHNGVTSVCGCQRWAKKRIEFMCIKTRLISAGLAGLALVGIGLLILSSLWGPCGSSNVIAVVAFYIVFLPVVILPSLGEATGILATPVIMFLCPVIIWASVVFLILSCWGKLKRLGHTNAGDQRTGLDSYLLAGCRYSFA